MAAGKVTKTKTAGAIVKNTRQQKEPGTREQLPPNWVRYISHKRVPIALTTNAWIAQNKYIVLYINPSEAQWSLPRRESVSKTAAGAIRNVWPNRYRGTIYDEGTVNFTFQTGNLLPGAGINQAIFGQRRVEEETYAATTEFAVPENATEEEHIAFLKQVTPKRKKNVRTLELADNVAEVVASPPVPPGLSNLYDFLEMVNQPMVWAGGENRHIVLYHSRIFPSIRLEGYFTGDAIAFNDSATSGNSTTWTASFQIYRSSPKWWKSSELHGMYSDTIRNMGGLSEIFGNEVDVKQLDQIYKNLNKEGQPENPNVSYKKEQTTGAVGKADKKPALVNKTDDAKTASKPGDTAPKNPEILAAQRVDALFQTAKWAGIGSPGNPYNTKLFVDTDAGAAIFKNLSAYAQSKSPPPTDAELKKQLISEFELIADPKMKEAYKSLIDHLKK